MGKIDSILVSSSLLSAVKSFPSPLTKAILSLRLNSTHSNEAPKRRMRTDWRGNGRGEGGGQQHPRNIKCACMRGWRGRFLAAALEAAGRWGGGAEAAAASEAADGGGGEANLHRAPPQEKKLSFCLEIVSLSLSLFPFQCCQMTSLIPKLV